MAKINVRMVVILFLTFFGGIRVDQAILMTLLDVHPLYKPLGNNTTFDGGVSQEELEIIEKHMNLTHYHPDKALEGLTILIPRMVNATTMHDIASYFLIVDMEGNIKTLKNFNLKERSGVEFINSSTLMYTFTQDITQDKFSHVVLWNLRNNRTEIFPLKYEGYHDVEYNPLTDTFLVLHLAEYGEWAGKPIVYDEISEVDRDNNTLWYFNSSLHVPFNESLFHNETVGQETWDWMHGNSLFWDIEENCVYYNARHLDTFYKISMDSNEIVWGVGRAGNMTCYDIHGNQKETLFYHGHSVEKIGPNRFILFDNDFHNSSRANYTREDIGVSRYVEILVDEEAGTAQEVWNWIPEGDYYSNPWGDADRLPNGNTLGCFGWGLSYSATDGVDHPLYFTEVNQAGEIVWEITFNRSQEWEWRGYRVERYLEQPIIDISEVLLEINEGEMALIRLSTWDVIRRRYHTNATLNVFNNSTLIAKKSFEFLPFWQETEVSINVTKLAVGIHYLNVVIENPDRIIAVKNVTVTVNALSTTTTTTTTSTTTSTT
ncbi:MAG: aryl-sulfate sulfotransferase, partial [Candidatus Heimdallarchaeota archaeon]